MSDRFIALDVCEGDAFYLVRGDYSFLIDGGNNKDAFPNIFESNTSKKYADIIIVTHNDSDHTKGIIGYLESKLRCNEIWLPAVWLVFHKRFSGDTSRFSNEIKEELSSIGSRRLKELLRMIFFEGLLFSLTINKETDSQEIHGKNSECIFEIWHTFLSIYLPDDYNKYLNSHMNNESLDSMFLPKKLKNYLHCLLMEYASNINQILKLACKHNIKCRFFKFDSNRSFGGIKNVMEPVNSTEIHSSNRKQQSRNLSFIDLLLLTMSNKRSLVFVSPKKGNFPGILFSADSDFSFTQSIPWKDNMIITVPHHGSTSNNKFFCRYKKDTKMKINNIWIRTYHGSVKLSDIFLKLHQLKYCTRCDKQIPKNQKIIFEARNSSWFIISGNKCVC